MASACCVHQISSLSLGSKLQEFQDRRSGAATTHSSSSAVLGSRTWKFCSYNHRRLMLQSAPTPRSGASSIVKSQRLAAAGMVRTIATTPDSEVGASDTEGDSTTSEVAEVIDVEAEEGAEDTEEVKKSLRQPKVKKKSLVHILEVGKFFQFDHSLLSCFPCYLFVLLFFFEQALHKQAIEEATKDRDIPDLRPGYVVQIRLEVPETKRRVSLLRGIVICRRNNGVNTTFTIRRIFAGVGVEMVFPLYSPNIKEITVLQKKKVRRAKLYYLRKKLARFSTF
ncbi:50S ribosomal protein L19-1, chloroplastic isoform X1 [Selaginella moellendorffii]|nr:50S ribosomal protein L19-1, chloroplastic isoform X1 [Selaginella moellendorffii]|eukprot:XP_024520922.1 50S ribosomal protein L19-1, chloroplastic isoform X1 [Selaginella moellendorffii]